MIIHIELGEAKFSPSSLLVNSQLIYLEISHKMFISIISFSQSAFIGLSPLAAYNRYIGLRKQILFKSIIRSRDILWNIFGQVRLADILSNQCVGSTLAQISPTKDIYMFKSLSIDIHIYIGLISCHPLGSFKSLIQYQYQY